MRLEFKKTALLSIFLTGSAFLGPYSYSLPFDGAKQCGKIFSPALSVSDVLKKPFTVPERSFVHSRVTSTTKKDIELKGAHPGDTPVTNLRRPFVEVDVTDLLKRSNIKIESLNEIFNLPEGKESNYIAIGNFAHGVENYKTPFERPLVGAEKTQYWFSVFPKKAKVTDSQLQVEWFAEGNGNHMQIHLSLDTPLLLIPEKVDSMVHQDWSISNIENRTQNGVWDIFGDTNKPVLIKGEIIYALMGLRSKNGPQEFSAVNGITGNLTVGLILASTAHMATDQMTHGSYIEEYKLKLNSQEQQSLFNYILSKNQTSELTDIYNTVFQNCITEVLRAIKYATLEKGGPAIDADQFNPFTVPQYLTATGLIDTNPASLNQVYGAANQSKVTSANEKTYKQIKMLQPVISSKQFDSFVRQFAYQASEKQWSANSINKYFKFIVEEIGSKPLAVFDTQNILNSDEKWSHDPDINQIKDIDQSVKLILGSEVKILQTLRKYISALTNTTNHSR